jgi:hypothetical protein
MTQAEKNGQALAIAIDRVANAIFPHYMDISKKEKVQTELLELVQQILKTVAQ